MVELKRSSLYHIESYQYTLPSELIAQKPLEHREESRMMVVDRRKGTREHHLFKELPAFLNDGDVVVVNDSRVFHARLSLQKPTGGRVDLLVLKVMAGRIQAYLERGKNIYSGLELFHQTGLAFRVLKKEERFLELEASRELTLEEIDRLGRLPLPPYIKREPAPPDEERYQTVFAREPGSIAAPTAGLHFSETMLQSLQNVGVDIVTVTLHVSLGTFQPVKVADIRRHRVYPEYYRISSEAADRVNTALERGRRVLCVGTTTVRALETSVRDGRVVPGEGKTELYIYPGFHFQVTGALLTNFHLPCSSLLMLVCAFGGYETIMDAYREAVERRYRFYSYGDCMLIL